MSSTFFGNSQRGGLADSRSGACNQNYFAGKLSLHEAISFCQSVRLPDKCSFRGLCFFLFAL
jgi:hypothetical protein